MAVNTPDILPRCVLAAFALAMSLAAGPAVAETVQIVAIGDSNTYGYGVKRPGAYPAQLEGLLRAKGYDVTIVNAGRNGDMTAEGMARLADAVPEGTDAAIVFLGRNDWRKGVPEVAIARNLDIIVGALRNQGIEVLLVGFDPNDFSAVAAKVRCPLLPRLLRRRDDAWPQARPIRDRRRHRPAPQRRRLRHRGRADAAHGRDADPAGPGLTAPSSRHDSRPDSTVAKGPRGGAAARHRNSIVLLVGWVALERPETRKKCFGGWHRPRFWAARLFFVLTAHLSAGTKTVEKPMFNGNRLGWCANWGADCGEPAAEAWCVAQGFAGAERFHEGPEDR